MVDGGFWPAGFVFGAGGCLPLWNGVGGVTTNSFIITRPSPRFALFRFLGATGLSWLAEDGVAGWLERLPSTPALVAARLAAPGGGGGGDGALPWALELAEHCVAAPVAEEVRARWRPSRNPAWRLSGEVERRPPGASRARSAARARMVRKTGVSETNTWNDRAFVWNQTCAATGPAEGDGATRGSTTPLPLSLSPRRARCRVP
jgi:hypothetical protein